MSSLNGKPDVIELARAQLDFSALNTGAPSVKQVLFKAQTIVPLATHPPLSKFAKPAAATVLACALLLLPWVPQQTVLGIAELQFDTRFAPAEAQQLIDTAVRGLARRQQALLGADFILRDDNRGQLTLHASSFTLHGAALQQELAAALNSGKTPPPVFTMTSAGDQVHVIRKSPVALAIEQLQPPADGPVAAYYPAAPLAQSVLKGEPLYKQELTSYLQRRGFELTGFAFSGNSALLPPSCQFTVDAWPQPVAVGVRHYFKLTAIQRQELAGHVEDWLQRANLRTPGLLVAMEPTALRPVICDVRDRQGRLDPLLTSRLNAALQDADPADLRDASTIDTAVSNAADEALSGIERRVDFERVSGLTDFPARFKVHVTMQGRLEDGAREVADPVDNSDVKEQF